MWGACVCVCEHIYASVYVGASFWEPDACESSPLSSFSNLAFLWLFPKGRVCRIELFYGQVWSFGPLAFAMIKSFCSKAIFTYPFLLKTLFMKVGKREQKQKEVEMEMEM